MSFEETIRAIVREELRAHDASKSDHGWEGCITLAEAAKLANVSVSTLEKWQRQGLSVVKRGHVRRVEVSELRDFLRQREPDKQTPKERVKEILAGLKRSA